MSSIRDFVPVKKLGEGSFSSVYLVRRVSDGQLYALKKVRMGSLRDKQKENSVNEVRLLASLSPDYVIAYKESFFDQNSSILCVVMEYADGGDLASRISQAKTRQQPIPEAEVWAALHDIVMGLRTLHERKILHRDLKSANVFIVDGRFKIGDLNVSKVAKNNLVHTQTGTPYYASPQVWRDEPYDAKSDIWSLGCILYQMAALRPPFRGHDMHSLFKSIQKGDYERLGKPYSSELLNIISACLKVNPKARPSAHQLLKNPLICKLKGPTQGSVPSPDLLRTIKVQKNMRNLQKNLPRANYEGQLFKQEERRPFSAAPSLSAALINRITKQECERKKLQQQLKKIEKKKLEEQKHLAEESKRKAIIMKQERYVESKAQKERRKVVSGSGSPVLAKPKPRVDSGKINRGRPEPESRAKAHTPLTPRIERREAREERAGGSQPRKQPGKILKRATSKKEHIARPVWWG